VDSAHLGKTAGKDLATEKATWPAVYGVEQSERDAARLIEEAFAALETPTEAGADGLKAVARYLVEAEELSPDCFKNRLDWGSWPPTLSPEKNPRSGSFDFAQEGWGTGLLWAYGDTTGAKAATGSGAGKPGLLGEDAAQVLALGRHLVDRVLHVAEEVLHLVDIAGQRLPPGSAASPAGRGCMPGPCRRRRRPGRRGARR